jgi:hypothetical protein
MPAKVFLKASQPPHPVIGGDEWTLYDTLAKQSGGAWASACAAFGFAYMPQGRSKDKGKSSAISRLAPHVDRFGRSFRLRELMEIRNGEH